jgi:hypothetical protein
MELVPPMFNTAPFPWIILPRPPSDEPMVRFPLFVSSTKTPFTVTLFIISVPVSDWELAPKR